jgi:hypothetical protein
MLFLKIYTTFFFLMLIKKVYHKNVNYLKRKLRIQLKFCCNSNNFNFIIINTIYYNCKNIYLQKCYKKIIMTLYSSNIY